MEKYTIVKGKRIFITQLATLHRLQNKRIEFDKVMNELSALDEQFVFETE